MSSAGHAVKANRESSPTYTEFHPRWYRPRVSTYWWLGKWAYVKFILRELSSVAVAWTVGVTLYLVRCVSQGPEAYGSFLRRMSSPLMIILNVIAFGFLMMHSITWFNLAPKAMVVRISGRRVPGALIVGPQYLAWIVISAIVFAIVLMQS